VIVDSSAVVAVLKREPLQEEMANKLEDAEVIAIGTPTLFETGIVTIGALGERGRGLLAQFLEAFEVEVIPFGGSHWEVAMEAFLRYGKGRHPAALNYGDCMTYATARLAEKPLLFVGKDFAQTDIQAA
jgi:ribonuclease VapC